MALETDALVAALGAPVSAEGVAGVQATFERTLRSARASWPTLNVAPEAFAQALCKSLEPGPLDAQLEKLALSDLYLATACAAGSHAGIEHLTRELLPAVCDSLRRVNQGSVTSDELIATLTEQLVLPGPNGRPPGIAQYAGRAPLLHWLRATALHGVLTQKRNADRRAQLETRSLASATPVGDVELELIRRLHGNDFRQAFETAFAGLTPRERTLLRMHVIDGLNIEQMGAFYRTHKTTVFRWLTAARKALAEGIRRALAQKLELSGREVESLLDFVGTELDLSLNRLLKTSVSHAP